MIVKYTPDGQEPQTWNFKPAKLRESRIEMIERRLGKLQGEKGGIPFDQFQAELMQGSASARRVLLWHLLNLAHPTLRIEDVDPLRDELDVQPTKQEMAVWRDTFAAMGAGGGDEREREMALAELDRRIDAAPDGDDDEGKALPHNNESVTG